jgi:hypothetical protein
MTSFRDLFPVPRPIVAMAYVPPLPGTPLGDESRGVDGLVEAVRADLKISCCASDAWRAPGRGSWLSPMTGYGDFMPATRFS